jgi:hypothetical protein
MKEKIPKQKSLEQQTQELKKSAIRTGSIILLALSSNFLPIKETKTAIFDPLANTNMSTSEQKDETSKLILNSDAAKNFSNKKEKQTFEHDINELETLTQAKIEFPDDFKSGEYTFNHKKILSYNQILRSTTEIAIFNQFLPPQNKIKTIRFVEAIQKLHTNSNTIQGCVKDDVIYISDLSDSGTGIHEMAHIISHGLNIDRNNRSIDGYNQLLDYLQGKNKNMSPEQLLDHGFRDYSFDSSRIELFTTVSEMLGEQSYETLNATQREQYDKILAFAATKQSVFGSEEFKRLVIDYGIAIHNSDFKTIDTKIKQNLLTLKAKVDQNQQLKTDQNVQKYIHQLELMKLKVNTLNGVKIYLPIFMFLVMVISLLETTVKIANTLEAKEKLTN